MFELLLAAAALQAPAAEADRLEAAARQDGEARAEVINVSPPGRALGLVQGADLSLDISEEKSELTIGYAWDRVSRDLTADQRGIRIAHNVLKVDLTLPIGGADNLLADDAFDAFAAGPTISASWNWFGWTSRDRFDEPPFGAIMADAVRGCRAAEGPQAPTDEECERHINRPNRRFAVDYSRRSEASINRALLSPAFGFGIEAELGFDLFEYRTPLTLQEGSETKPNFTASASAFYFPTDGMSLITGSVEYENSFKAQDNQILCRAVVADPNEDCVSAPPGPPRNEESLSLSLEYRRVLGSVPGLGRFAIAPQASYDVVGDDYRLELPVYLALAGDSAFLPGLSFTYDSEDDDFIIGVFLRRSFSLGR